MVIEYLKVAVLVLLVTACDSSVDNLDSTAESQDSYIKQCYENSSVFKHKQLQVKNALKSLLAMDNYIALKQSTVSYFYYNFMLIGITGNDATLVYMSNSMQKPIIKSLDYKFASNLIQKGKSILNSPKPVFFTEGVNGIPCYSLRDEKSGYAVAGRSSDNRFVSYISTLEQLAFKLKKGELDHSVKFEKQEIFNELSLDKMFFELEYLLDTYKF